MSTDSAWEEWGSTEPYYGVITDPRFRRARLTNEVRHEFFESGRRHVEHVLTMIRTHIDPHYQAQSVLDFGCGVGRTLVHFARSSQKVVGLDVSPSMLAEARKNCAIEGVTNAIVQVSDDTLSMLSEEFDLIHSYIVFQHIPPERGKQLFQRLISHLGRGGVGALHILYSKDRYASSLGVAPAAVLAETSVVPRQPRDDPEMQMNPYNLTELLFMLQASGVVRLHIELTKHDGELGAFLFFQKPA